MPQQISPETQPITSNSAESGVIIIGHNQAGEVRYIQQVRAGGACATGITADKAKATVYESWEVANKALATIEQFNTWSYAWRVRDAVVKPVVDICIAGNPAVNGLCGNADCVCTPERPQSEAERLLVRAATLQHEFWDALRALEVEAQIEIDSTEDLDNCTIASLTRQSQYIRFGMVSLFDYKHQAWTRNGLYVACGHPEAMECGCYGRLHAGEPVAADADLH